MLGSYDFGGLGGGLTYVLRDRVEEAVDAAAFVVLVQLGVDVTLADQGVYGEGKVGAVDLEGLTVGGDFDGAVLIRIQLATEENIDLEGAAAERGVECGLLEGGDHEITPTYPVGRHTASASR
jgi:hypothetical protein